MANYLEYEGNTYNLDDPLAVNHLKKMADDAGLSYEDFLIEARNAEAITTARKKAFDAGKNFKTLKDGIEIYPSEVDGVTTYKYALNDKPIVVVPKGDMKQTIALPNPYDGVRSVKPTVMVAPATNESGETLDDALSRLKNPEGSTETWPELSGATEQSTAEPVATAPASTDDAFNEAMMKYYQGKDAKGGTKLAEWAGNFPVLAKRNYENQIRRNPELANPAQSFKDSWVSEVFGRSLSASDAQLPDFAPGSSNLNFSKSYEVENSPNVPKTFNDFSRNNITPKEVYEQDVDLFGDMEIEGVDYSKLYKSFEPNKLF